jgi:hypothetical protein
MRALIIRPVNTLLVFRAVAKAGTRPALAHAAGGRADASPHRINAAPNLRTALITGSGDPLAVSGIGTESRAGLFYAYHRAHGPANQEDSP